MTISLQSVHRTERVPFSVYVTDGLTSASIYNHMYFPTSYGDRSAEYDRLLKGVAMWDVSIERQVALKAGMQSSLRGISQAEIWATYRSVKVNTFHSAITKGDS